MAYIRSLEFESVESLFVDASKEEIKDIAVSSIQHVVDELDGDVERPALFRMLLSGVKWGIYNTRDMNEPEKELFNRIFQRIYEGPMEDLYGMISVGRDETDQNVIIFMTHLGNHVAIPFLLYILSFAYIDGEMEDDLAIELENMFASNLDEHFIGTDLEVALEEDNSVVQLPELEAQIVNWLKDGNSPYLNEINKHFSNKTTKEIQNALDYLEEMNIVFDTDTIVGKMYGLVNLDIQISVQSKDSTIQKNADQAKVVKEKKDLDKKNQKKSVGSEVKQKDDNVIKKVASTKKKVSDDKPLDKTTKTNKQKITSKGRLTEVPFDELEYFALDVNNVKGDAAPENVGIKEGGSSKKTKVRLDKTNTVVQDNYENKQLDPKKLYEKYKRKIKSTNNVILGTTPLKRSNDSRAKRMKENTQELLNQYAMEVCDYIGFLEKKANELGEFGDGIKEVIQEIISCYDALNVEYTLQLLPSKAEYMNCIVSCNPQSMSKKWKKKYDSLPEFILPKLKAKASELETKRKSITTKLNLKTGKLNAMTEEKNAIIEKMDEIKSRLSSISSEKDEQYKKIEELRKVLVVIDSQVEERKKSLDLARQNRANIENEKRTVMEEMGKNNSDLKEKFAETNKNLWGYDECIKRESQKRDELESKQKDYERKIDDERTAAANSFLFKKKHQNEAIRLGNELQEINKSLESVNLNIIDMNSRRQSSISYIEVEKGKAEEKDKIYRTKLSEIENALNACDKDIEMYEMAFSSVFNEQKKELEEISKCREKLSELGTEEKKCNNEVNKLNIRQEKIVQNEKKMIVQMEELQKEKEKFESDITDKKKKIDEIKSKLKG